MYWLRYYSLPQVPDVCYVKSRRTDPIHIIMSTSGDHSSRAELKAVSCKASRNIAQSSEEADKRGVIFWGSQSGTKSVNFVSVSAQ